MKLYTCNVCREDQPPENFHKNRKLKRGFDYTYKVCRSNTRKDIYDYNKSREKHLKKKYNITLSDYAAMLEAQGGVCALCKRGPETSKYEILAVDHDHITGKVRGLLCFNCNSAVGKLGDTVEAFEKVIEYLKGRGLP